MSLLLVLLYKLTLTVHCEPTHGPAYRHSYPLVCRYFSKSFTVKRSELFAPLWRYLCSTSSEKSPTYFHKNIKATAAFSYTVAFSLLICRFCISPTLNVYLILSYTIRSTRCQYLPYFCIAAITQRILVRSEPLFIEPAV